MLYPQTGLQIIKTHRGYESGLSVTAAKARHLDSAFRRAGFQPRGMDRVPREDLRWIVSSLVSEHQKLVNHREAIIVPKNQVRYNTGNNNGFFDVIDWDLNRLTTIHHDPTIIIVEETPETLSLQVFDLVGYELEVNAIMYYSLYGKDSPKFRQAIRELANTRGEDLYYAYSGLISKAKEIQARINEPERPAGAPAWLKEDVYAIRTTGRGKAFA
jgi:hypothetical protein